MCLCQRGRWTDTKVSCCFKYQFFSFSFHFFCIKLLNSKPIDNQHSRLNIYVYAFSRRFHPKWQCKRMINDQIYSLTQPCYIAVYPLPVVVIQAENQTFNELCFITSRRCLLLMWCEKGKTAGNTSLITLWITLIAGSSSCCCVTRSGALSWWAGVSVITAFLS